MCEWPVRETNLAEGISAAARLAASCISSASPAQIRQGTLQAVKSCETGPSARSDRQAASSASGSFFSIVQVRSGSGKAVRERRLEGFDEAAHAPLPGGGNGSGDRLGGRRLEIPVVWLVAAENEREHTLGGVLSDCET